MACKCYHAERNFLGKIGVCWGTKECEACSCGGDESKCDFYPEVRKRSILRSFKADLVNVIRCKDCGFYEKTTGIEGEDIMVCTFHYKASYPRLPDDYCSKGVRKHDP